MANEHSQDFAGYPNSLVNKAYVVYYRAIAKNKEIAFDPFTIIMIIQLIIALIKLYQTCHKNNTQTLDMMRYPNIFERRILRKEINKLMDAGFKLRREDLENGLKELAFTLRPQDLKKLFEDVK